MAVFIPQVRVGPTLQEQLHDVGSTKAGSIVKRGGLETPIDISAMLQEILHLQKREREEDVNTTSGNTNIPNPYHFVCAKCSCPVQ